MGAYYTLPSTSGTGTTTYATNFNYGGPLLAGPNASAPDLYAGITSVNSAVTSTQQLTTTTTGFSASVSAAPTFAAAQLAHDWNGGGGNVNDGVGAPTALWKAEPRYPTGQLCWSITPTTCLRSNRELVNTFSFQATSCRRRVKH